MSANPPPITERQPLAAEGRTQPPTTVLLDWSEDLKRSDARR
jgi:hypothetical protein